MSTQTTAHPEAVATLISNAIESGAAMLAEPAGKQLLADFGIAVPRGNSDRDATTAAAELKGPLAIKVVASTLVHKSDAGGVRIGIDPADVAGVAAEMKRDVNQHGHSVDSFLVEEMAPRGQEVVVGAVRNPGVGWVVMVGLGGVLVEVLADVAFGVAPLEAADIRRMLQTLRGLPLLQGARGAQPADIDALVTLVERLAGEGGLLAALPDSVTEVDLNPVIVSPHGAVAVDARFILDRAAGAAPAALAARSVELSSFEALYEPQTIGVLGASAQGANMGTRYIESLQGAGFTGRIVPIHPKASEIAGLQAFPSIQDVDGVVDYAYVALPAERVADALTADAGKLRFAQVVSSGFGEVPEGVGIEQELVERMRAQGTRLIGPNCLGTHSSPGKFSFIPKPPFSDGGVVVVSQSGGLSVDILRLGTAKGVGFRSVTSMGNGADVASAELVDYALSDTATSVVGLYLESLGEARDVLRVLQQHPNRKPVVLLGGGRTADGSRAASSHTGALAGNHRLWPAVASQAGIALVDTLDEFLDVLLAFDTLDLTGSADGDGVVLFGNGGGASVLAADALGRRGLSTPPLPDAAIAALEAMELPPGNGLANPIDTPAGTLAVDGGAVAGAIMSVVLEHSAPAAVITHLNVGIIQRNLAATHGDVTGEIIRSLAEARNSATRKSHLFMVLKGDGERDIDDAIADYAVRARAAGLPVYGDIEAAATAVHAVLTHQQRVSSNSFDAHDSKAG